MRRLIGLAAILFSLALFAGCPYTTKVPLGEPDRADFDERLVGLWTGFDGKEETGLIRVFPFNDAEYYIEAGGEGEELDRYRAFVFKIGGELFLHFNKLALDGTEQEYCFARYAFSESGELTLRFVGEKIVPKDLRAEPKSLKKFIASHLDDPALDDEDIKLIVKNKS